jgi:hypothetical protein
MLLALAYLQHFQLLEGFFSQTRVGAEALDLEKTSVGWEADLPLLPTTAKCW